MLLADTAMILRNWALVLLFVLPHGVQPAFATLVVVPMMLVAAGATSSAMVFAQKSQRRLVHRQPPPRPQQNAEEGREENHRMFFNDCCMRPSNWQRNPWPLNNQEPLSGQVRHQKCWRTPD